MLRMLNELGDLLLLSSNEVPFAIGGVNYRTAPFTHINSEGSRFSYSDFGVFYLADTIDMRCLKVTFSASIVDFFRLKVFIKKKMTRYQASLAQSLKMFSKAFNITR